MTKQFKVKSHRLLVGEDTIIKGKSYCEDQVTLEIPRHTVWSIIEQLIGRLRYGTDGTVKYTLLGKLEIEEVGFLDIPE